MPSPSPSASSWLSFLGGIVGSSSSSSSSISHSRLSLVLAAVLAVALTTAFRYRRSAPVATTLALTYFPVITALTRARRAALSASHSPNLHPNHSHALESLVAFLRWLPNGETGTIQHLRAGTDTLSALELSQAKAMLQSDAAVEVVAREGKVRGLWIENGVTKPANGQPFTPAGIANKAVLLFAHGGGMNFGTAKSYALHHAHLVTAFNKQAEHRRRSLAVFSVEYPLAPEHTHPAQIDAVAEAYDWLKDVLGVEDLFVGGDSAGGLLVLQLVARLQNNGKPTPKKVILISPWVDPASTVPIPRSRFVFDYIEPPLSRLCLQNYFPRGIDSRAARVDGPDAPLAAVEPGLSDPEKYPPPMAKRTLIVYGDAETLAEPIERFIDAARAATTGKDGADPDRLRVVVGEGMPHEYPVLGLNLPGIAGRLAREAVETEAEFLTRV